jgi:hypothetical protein
VRSLAARAFAALRGQSGLRAVDPVQEGS